MDFNADYGLNTFLAHFGEEEKVKGAVVPPIFQNSLFVFDSYEEFVSGIYERPQGPPYHYSRIGNPTVDLAERKIAQLEGMEAAKLCGTGMGAITLAVMSCVEAGAHVVAVDTCYVPTRYLFEQYLAKFGVTVTFVSGRCKEEIFDSIRPETKLVYLESPSSIVFRLQDVEAIAQHCREKKVTTIIDNTYCTPIFSNPGKMGIDIVVHSGTKYFSGHSDLTAGAVCSTQERIDQLARIEINLLGSILAPFPAWLLTRGLRTLGIRMKRHEETGNTVAAWLEEQPQIERVNHVGLPSYPQRDLFLKQMRGSSSLFSIEPKNQNKDAVIRFVEKLTLFQLGISWGGFESLVVPLHAKPDDWDEPRWLVRLFCGLEEPEDLIADLKQALVELN
ncbi:MAG TPA: PLP-dependent aspartate aminotransferase family protein [Fimbriimonadaceae bacterium]|nr:PLP-dependent aspartate aminotransferase family protein [Fimbriimonadaceae bacterium]